MKKPILLALTATAVGLLAVWQWPRIQETVSPIIPEFLFALAGSMAAIGVFFAVAPMMLGLVPSFHRARILLYAIAVSLFLVGLVEQPNSGFIFLETALLTQFVWSFVANRKQHQPIAQKGWHRGLIIMGVSGAVGVLAIALWPEPVHWAYWVQFSLVSGLVLFATITLLETGLISGGSWQFVTLNSLGSAGLLISTLGQFNLTGLMLNSAMLTVAVLALAWPPKQAQATA